MDYVIKNQKIGFIPLSFNLAETGRAVLVAREVEKLGGIPVFFSHGGEYEYLIKKLGFNTTRLKPFFSKEVVKHIISVNRGEKKGIPYSESFIRTAVNEEIKAFKETKIKLIVSFVNLSTSISARVSKIPLVCVSPAPGKFHLRCPDNFENIITRFIPQKIKIAYLNYSFYKSKKFLKPFNKVAKEFNLKPFNTTMDLVCGDVTLGTNFLEYINVLPNQQTLPDNDYIGIISLDDIFSKQYSKEENKKVNDKIKNHFKNANKKILTTMGSSGDKEFFIRILKTLNKTNYKVLAVYANILDENNLPNLSDNILLLKFVPSIENLHKIVDISIIHGGQGTVFASAYAGKPIIGIPMNFEQHLNLEKIVGHKSGIMISRKYFKEKNFLNSIKRVFDSYNFYYKNAQSLSNKLPTANGAKNAALRINQIYNDYLVT